MHNYLSNFPLSRLRRVRSEEWIRQLVNESNLSINDLILPIFINYHKKSTKIDTMPGISRYCLNDAIEVANAAKEIGIKAIAIFPEVPTEKKDANGSEALNDNNIVCKAIRKIKENIKNLGVICDIALDPYTLSGHDGILEDGKVNNDKTVEILVKQAKLNVDAGCDIIAPSDMMDGRVKNIREMLEKNNYHNTLIMSYAAKYASCFYGPFRDAVSASTNLGQDKKKSYQMQFGNSQEALRETALDIKEGADIILIKPGMSYLDIIKSVKETFNFPTFCYQVSGEYSMIKNSILSNIFEEKDIVIETLSCFKRAGADAILTYFAMDAAKILTKQK